MGDFDSAPLWMRLAMWMVDIAIILFCFAMAMGGYGVNDITTAMLILGFICLLVAVVLAQALVYLDELKENKPALICLIVFALVAAVCMTVGLAWNSLNNKGYSVYAVNVTGWAVVCALLGGIFAILQIVGVKA